MAKPQSGDFAEYYGRYVNMVDTDNLSAAISNYALQITEFFKSIPDDKAGYRYAEGKWSLKELLQHIIDTERIFSYRALCIARKDATPLPGFDENTYAANSNADARDWRDLLHEFERVRNSTDLLYKSFSEEQLQQKGTSNNNPITVNALGFITIGHILHHKNVIADRYLGVGQENRR